MVGGEFASTVEDEGRDDVANTFVQDMSVVCTGEVRASTKMVSHDGFLPSIGSESVSSFHTASSIFKEINCGLQGSRLMLPHIISIILSH